MEAVLVAAAGSTAGVGAGAGARLLLGRLRRGARIRAGGCEAAVGILWGVTVAGGAVGALPTAWVPALLGLGWLGVAAGAVDIAHRRLPDALTLPALPVALLLLLPLGPPAVLRAVGGAAVAVTVHGAVHLLAPHAMGAGDVKLAGPLGAVLAAAGWSAMALAALLAAALTAGVGVAGMLGRGPPRGAALPHGPSMLAASWVVTTLLAGAGLAAAPGGG